MSNTDATVTQPDFRDIVMQRAMDMLTGKGKIGGGGGGGGGLPVPPAPAMDFSKMLGAFSAQEVPETIMPRTAGMSIEDVRKEWEGVNTAMDKQMDMYLSTGGAANAQQQQVFENALKIKQLQHQQAAQGRAEMNQYLQLAHQMMTEKKQEAMLNLQLAKEARMEKRDIAKQEHEAKQLERQTSILEMQMKKEQRLAETDLLNRQKTQAQIEALEAKKTQTGKLSQTAQNLRQFALDRFGGGISTEQRIALATDEGLARHLETAYDIAKRDVGTVTQSKYESLVEKAFKDYTKKGPGVTTTSTPSTLDAQILNIFRQVGGME